MSSPLLVHPAAVLPVRCVPDDWDLDAELAALLGADGWPLDPPGCPVDAAVFGRQKPVLFSCPPWVASAGAEVVELAASTGLFLDPWEAWFITQALGVNRRGKWAAFAVKIIVSRQNGKGAILEARELGGLFHFGEELLIHSAHRFNTCELAFKRMLTRIEANPDLDRKVARTPASHGEEGIELFPTPAIITGPGGKQVTESRTPSLRYFARSGSAARGFTGDLVVYDEDMVLDAADVAASLPTMSARVNHTEGGPQVWYAGSAGLGKQSTQAARVRKRGLTGGTSLCFAEWSITPHDEYCPPGRCEDAGHDDPLSVASLAKANPGLGLRLTEEHSAHELDEMGLEWYSRERLGVGKYPAPEDGWAVISKRRWDERRAADDQRPSGLAGGIDVSQGREASAIGLCGKRDDGRRGVEIARYDRGTSWVVPEAARIDRQWGPMVWAVDPRSHAGSLIPALEDEGLRVEKLTASTAAAAFGMFFDAVRDDELAHDGSAEVAKALAGADTRKLSDGLAWDRVASSVDLCPLIADTWAHWAHKVFGGQGDYDVRDSLGFDWREVVRLIKLGTYGAPDVERLFASGIITDKDVALIVEATHITVRATQRG